jgi:broad specificity phosphatase PhoE
MEEYHITIKLRQTRLLSQSLLLPPDGGQTLRQLNGSQLIWLLYGIKEKNMAQLYVVRHGQTDWNVQNRYQGASDVVLNATGRQQANEVAERIQQNYTVDIVVSSPLRRARETADIIATVLNIDVCIMKQFTERNVGVYEGLTPVEAKSRYPEIWAQNITRHLNTAPIGGETILEVGSRILDGLNHIKMHYQSKNVVLVAHGYVARMINGILNRVSDDLFHSYRLENGEIAAHQF